MARLRSAAKSSAAASAVAAPAVVGDLCDDETVAFARDIVGFEATEALTVGGWPQSDGKKTNAQVRLTLGATRKEKGGKEPVHEIALNRTEQSTRGVPSTC